MTEISDNSFPYTTLRDISEMWFTNLSTVMASSEVPVLN